MAWDNSHGWSSTPGPSNRRPVSSHDRDCHIYLSKFQVHIHQMVLLVSFIIKQDDCWGFETRPRDVLFFFSPPPQSIQTSRSSWTVNGERLAPACKHIHISTNNENRATILIMPRRTRASRFASNRRLASLASFPSLLLKAYKLHDSAEQAMVSVLFQHASKFTWHEQRELRSLLDHVEEKPGSSNVFWSPSPHYHPPSYVKPTNHQPRERGLSERRREDGVFACSETFGSVVIVVVSEERGSFL